MNRFFASPGIAAVAGFGMCVGGVGRRLQADARRMAESPSSRKMFRFARFWMSGRGSERPPSSTPIRSTVRR